MNESTASAYAKKFNQVFDYIDKHLDEDLSVERLSRVANFSKYHFHRQFSEYAGINVFRYIQLMRLRRASYRLVFSEHTRIIDIALEAGFENPESFSRAFKNMFGQTPSQFRSKPEWQPWNEQYRIPPSKRKQTMQVNIVEFTGTKIAVLEHRGAPETVNDSVKVFIDWRKQSGLSPRDTSRTFGLIYDNPDTTPPACRTIRKAWSINLSPVAVVRWCATMARTTALVRAPITCIAIGYRIVAKSCGISRYFSII